MALEEFVAIHPLLFQDYVIMDGSLRDATLDKFGGYGGGISVKEAEKDSQPNEQFGETTKSRI